MELRPYQKSTLEASKNKYDAGITRQLVSLPTGVGKAVILACLKQHHKIDKKKLVLVHREELADQLCRTIKLWNPDYNVSIEMADRECDPRSDVVVASVPTIGRAGNSRIRKFNPADFGAIVCDEAHHSIAPSWTNILHTHFNINKPDNRTLLAGFTATPNRGDGQGLGQVYDDIIYQMSILDAIKQGWLVDLKGYKISTGTDISGIRTVAGDFSQGELEKAVNVYERNHLIVQNWLRDGEYRQTVAFCVDIAHAKGLADTFKAYGVQAEAIWGTDPDRADKLAQHKAKKIQVLTNCGVLTEGYDDWQISCIIMARPTKSQLLFVQMAGRGTRIPSDVDNLITAKAAGQFLAKEDCILMDVVDNTGKHSLVTLASLFGLPAKLNVKGESIIAAQAGYAAAQQANPQLNLSQIESLDDIHVVVERADLFSIKFPEEVLGNSKLRWTPTLDGGYIINLPYNNEAVTLSKDLLDKWDIRGTVNGNKFEHQGINELPEAFRVADGLVTTFGRGFLTLLRQESKWRTAGITKPQENMLKRLYKYRPEIIAQIGTLSRGEASHLIDQAIKKPSQVAGRP
jgi:ATP-dependent helicase IRC3